MDLDTLVAQLPESQREPAKKVIPALAKALEKEGILTPKVLSYAIATAGHESGFVPKEEKMAQRGLNARNDRIAALQDNYEGGKAFKGRGLIQLTHRGNYEKYGQRIGEDLVNNPDRLLDPDVSARVLAAYFKDTGVADAAEQGDYTRARVLVQGRGATNPDFIGTTNEIGRQAATLSEKVSDPKVFIPKEETIPLPQVTQPTKADLGASSPSPSAQITQPQTSAVAQPSPGQNQPLSPTPSQPGLDPRLQQTMEKPAVLQQAARPYGDKVDPRLKFSQGYGSRPQVYGRANLSGHEGYDFIVKENTPLYSPINGTVERVGDPNNPILKRSYGNYVFIRGEDGSGLLLGHNNKVDVKPGQQIKTGDQLGLTGNTGFSEKPHIHASFAPRADVALESMDHFEKTGSHKVRGGGFADPGKQFTTEYANRFVNPKALASPAQEASPSTGVTQALQNPKTQTDQDVQKIVQQTLQNPQKQNTPSLPKIPTPVQNVASQFGDKVTKITEGMKNPLSFSTSPTTALETPQKLQLSSQRQPEQPNLPAPSFDVGSRPQTKVSTSQPFSPGFSQQIGGITQSFSDVVKQAFKPPETPQQQQQNQQNPDPQQPNQPQNYTQAQQAGIKAREAAQAKQRQAASPSSQGQSFSGGVASKPQSFATSSVQRATPITTTSKPSTYTVQKGDTLWGIAQKQLGSGAQFKSLGYKGDPRKLQVGQKLTIPRPR